MINFTILNKLRIVLLFIFKSSFGFAEQFTSVWLFHYLKYYISCFFKIFLTVQRTTISRAGHNFAISLRWRYDINNPFSNDDYVIGMFIFALVLVLHASFYYILLKVWNVTIIIHGILYSICKPHLWNINNFFIIDYFIL